MSCDSIENSIFHEPVLRASNGIVSIIQKLNQNRQGSVCKSFARYCLYFEHKAPVTLIIFRNGLPNKFVYGRNLWRYVLPTVA